MPALADAPPDAVQLSRWQAWHLRVCLTRVKYSRPKQRILVILLVLVLGGLSAAACGRVLGLDDLALDPDGGLIDRGLVVRYFIDEAASGTQPLFLIDSTDDPLSLPLYYEQGFGFSQNDSHRGLSWNSSQQRGHAGVNINGTKLMTLLNGSTYATIEFVADIKSITDNISRIVSIGTGDIGGNLLVGTDESNRLKLYWDYGVTVGEWILPLTTFGRSVVHVVIDTTAEAEADRVQLYINNMKIGRLPGMSPGQDEPIDLPDDAQLTLGNSFGGAVSFSGTLYYAAVYNEAFTPEEIIANTALLTERDDTPGLRDNSADAAPPDAAPPDSAPPDAAPPDAAPQLDAGT